MQETAHQPPFSLQNAANAEMVRNGFRLGLNEEALAQLAGIDVAPLAGGRDEQDALWSSIDNDTSRDLDQVEFAERVAAGVRVRVGIADVAGVVAQDSAIDRFAAEQTLTVYTAVHNYPMLPKELSTDRTSLNVHAARAAMVVAFTVSAAGERLDAAIYEASVVNHAQLAYSRVGPWLEGVRTLDAGIDAALAEQLALQDEAARALHARRVKLGALEFNRAEADPILVDGVVQGLRTATHNRAMDLIEELMIAANETMASTLRLAGRSSIRRVVQTPARWDRIVDVVARAGTQLPAVPDSAALNAFLEAKRVSDPEHYPDLALAIIKLMGPGQYVLAKGGDEGAQQGHFGLAAQDYTHSTAPNRRFVDLVTQRIVKAYLAGDAAPYTDDELGQIAVHCLEREGAARKVERAMMKRVSAVGLASSVGKTFRGVITGASPKGTYVRIFDPPVEGRVTEREAGLDVGDQVNVVLLRTDAVHAYIDFGRA